MNAYVWFFLLAAVAGTTLYVYIPSWIQHWREASKRIDADIRLLQSIPKGMEDEL